MREGGAVYAVVGDHLGGVTVLAWGAARQGDAGSAVWGHSGGARGLPRGPAVHRSAAGERP